VSDDQAKEILRALAAGKRVARYDVLEVLAHQRCLLRA
jgi:hypothetical protein